MRLVLVRHAMPALDPAVPPHEWQLDAEGHAAAQALAEVLREVLPGVRCARLVASEEPKAYHTLAGLGTVLRDPRFGEARRGPEPWGGARLDIANTVWSSRALQGGSMSRVLPGAVLGIGAGVAAGAAMGSRWVLAGIGLAIIGLVWLLVAGGWQPTTSTGAKDQAERPALATMGTHVEQILRTAEASVDSRLADARAEAEQILTAARTQAAALVERARAEAATLRGGGAGASFQDGTSP